MKLSKSAAYCAATLNAFGALPTIATATPLIANVEFDQRMLWGAEKDKSQIDLSRFSNGNPVLPGTQLVQLYINDTFDQERSVQFITPLEGGNAVACLTPEQLRLIALDTEKLELQQRQWLSGVGTSVPRCQPIHQVIPGASSHYDTSEQRLDMTVPQLYVAEYPVDYIAPALWDNGITAGRMNYALNVFQAQYQGQRDTQGFLQLDTGFNYENWRFRQLSSLTHNNGSQTYERQRTYVQTDVPSLSSTLTLGETYTDGQIFDSYNIRGAMLATDDRMWPASQRGYAPVVRGTANSNAKVTISQAGVTMYQRSVAPGPFEINDLYPVGYGSDLVVTITEADGQSRTFTVPYSASAQLLRPGQQRFFSAIGEAAGPGQDQYTPKVAQLSATYGLNNALTAYSGVIASDDYRAVTLGSAFSTPAGAVSADITYAQNLLDSVASGEGSSLRVLYSKLFDATQTNLTLSSYRYSTQGFWSFSDMVQSENYRLAGRTVHDRQVYSVNDKQKSRFSINLTQSLGPGWGSLFLSGETRDYWNRSGSDTLYQFSYSNTYKRLNYSLEANRSINQDGFNTTQYTLSFTLPLFPSDNRSRQYVTSRNTMDSHNNGQAQATLSGSAGEDGQYSYSATTAHALGSSNNQSSQALNGAYQGAVASLSGGITKGDGYNQANLGIAGGLIAHSGGLSFSQTLGSTVALVEAEHADGAKIINSYGAKVTGDGYGVAPVLTPYSRNRVELDSIGLSTDLQLDSSSVETIPSAGAIVRVKFATSQQSSGLVTAKLADGSPLPFGADVRDSINGNTVGYVGQGGNIFVRGIEPNGQLFVLLNKSERCVIRYTLIKKTPTAEGMTAVAHASGTCDPLPASIPHVTSK